MTTVIVQIVGNLIDYIVSFMFLLEFLGRLRPTYYGCALCNKCVPVVFTVKIVGYLDCRKVVPRAFYLAYCKLAENASLNTFIYIYIYIVHNSKI